MPAWHIESLENLSGDSLGLDMRDGELSESGQHLLNFEIGGNFGFINLNGELKLLEPVDYKVALSDRSFINYSNLPNTFVIQDIGGEYVSSFQTSGYPKFSENGNRLFMIKNDSTGISEITEQGDLKWYIDFTSLITSLSITDEYVLVGLLDGRLRLLNNLGESVFDVSPGGSRMQVIYGCSINDDGTVIAGVSGLYPQRFFYIKGPDFNNANVTFLDLDSDFRREIFISFSDSGKYIFFEGLGNVNIFDLTNNQLNQIPIKGSLTGIEELETRGVISILSEYYLGTELQIFRLNNNLIYEENIPHKEVFIKNISDSLLIGYSVKEEDGQYNTHMLRYDLKDM